MLVLVVPLEVAPEQDNHVLIMMAQRLSMNFRSVASEDWLVPPGSSRWLVSARYKHETVVAAHG